ncbi:asparaginase [Aminicella lysinilytica]|uniref:asparaginase n=1 Tax=Aminicella lysinilytica TaxID=433323 RepID=A0A4R6PZM0_9FIRM|nr:asparaginase [Aminicella lysinilytica]TDP51835.1 asparaginase [Aminicella lysinilytica]
MKKICIIYTGGTIGMVPTDQGYAPEAGSFAAALAGIDDLSAEGMPAWDLIEFDPLLDSSNIAVDQWNQIGRVIRDNYDSYDGFVVLHGTDTMAYTASALSFMLEGLDKPVILTGSQIPLCRLRSDARDNLITSILIAGEGKACEVCLYFGGRLIRGNRATKASADGLIAFDSPNYPLLAEAGIDIRYNKRVLGGLSAGEFHLAEFRETSIGVIKVFPGIQFQLFEPIMTEGLNGIVLETFGTGNIPNYDDALLPMIKRAFDNGTIVVVCSQCPQGTVRLGAYEVSAALTRAGAVSGFNMTTEAAVAKLYYLFSKGYNRDRVKVEMEEDLRGELTL